MYKSIRLALPAILLFFTLQLTFGQDISNNTFGKGIRMAAKDSSMTMKFGLRFSTLYEGFQNIETNEYVDNLLIRRFRLKFDGFIVSPKLVYKVEIGISNRDIGGVDQRTNGAARLILDGVLKWNFAGNFVLWFGQTKLPGNRERVVSSQKLQFVDRSLLNSRFNLDRDIGLQLHYHHRAGRMVVREVFSISKGEGRNITITSKPGYDYTGRIELLPFGLFAKNGDYFESDLVREPRPKLSLGATYDYNMGANRVRGQLGEWTEERKDLSTWLLDAIYKHNGFSAMFEYANRQSIGSSYGGLDDNGDPIWFYTGSAINGQAAYLFKNNIEVGLRATAVNQDPETGRSDLRQYTVGLSKYIVGHNLKAQADITYIDEVGGVDLMMYRFQIEMAF